MYNRFVYQSSTWNSFRVATNSRKRSPIDYAITCTKVTRNVKKEIEREREREREREKFESITLSRVTQPRGANNGHPLICMVLRFLLTNYIRPEENYRFAKVVRELIR